MSENHNPDTITVTIDKKDAETLTIRCSGWTKSYQKAMYTLRDLLNKELDK